MADHVAGTNFYLEVSRGSFGRYFTTHRNAFVSGLTTTERTVWPLAATLDRLTPSVASIIDIVSSSADDNISGTGLRTVLIEGVDGIGDAVSEIVELNGTSVVQTVNEYFRINRLFIMSSGTNKTNVGRIDAKIGATIHEVIMPGKGRSESAIYSAPNGASGYITNFSASTDGGKTAQIDIYYNNGLKFIVHTQVLSGNSTDQIFPSTPKIPPGTMLEIRAKGIGVDPGTNLAVSFDLIVDREDFLNA